LRILQKVIGRVRRFVHERRLTNPVVESDILRQTTMLNNNLRPTTIPHTK